MNGRAIRDFVLMLIMFAAAGLPAPRRSWLPRPLRALASNLCTAQSQICQSIVSEFVQLFPLAIDFNPTPDGRHRPPHILHDAIAPR
jgi:hypothetical protein